jgi:TatD DNase family protein
MTLFDTHFHYYQECPVSEYADEAHAAGTTYLMAVGADLKESTIASEFAAQVKNCWFTAGVHPHQADHYIHDISMFNQFIQNPEMVAVGEIGLDYFYGNSDTKNQLTVFESFLNWSLEIDKPAIVHCRDRDDRDTAYQDAYSRLKEFAQNGGRFVVHCFTGTTDWAKKFLDLGAYLGIIGIATFPKAENVRDVVKIIPDSRLLLETDSPYLAPVPHRGKKNHPAYLTNVAAKVADVRQQDVEIIAKMTVKNGLNFFRINPT